MFNYSVDLKATFPSVQVSVCVCVPPHASRISLFLEACSVPFYAPLVQHPVITMFCVQQT